MNEYHKIQTIYKRDPGNNYKTLLEGQFSKPEFEYLKDSKWVFTEKVDGTNIRVIYNNEIVNFGGRTDNAQMPANLVSKLQELLPLDMFKKNELPHLCLYGEGYGAKIQKGGDDYIRDGVNFILFDVKIGNVWLERFNVEDIGKKLNIKVVPIIFEGKILEGIQLCKDEFKSQLKATSPEGLVMRPKVELFNRRGERVISKIKLKDFKE